MKKLTVFLCGVLTSFFVLAQPPLPTVHLLQAGIGLTPSGKQQLIAYPERVLQKQVVSVHIGKVAGKSIVMLATKDNRLFTLSLNAPTRWRQVAQPDLRYGSYHVHDFLITPTGEYYLATSNGLYQSQHVVASPYRATLQQWQFHNNFLDSNLLHLQWVQQGKQKHPTVRAVAQNGAQYATQDQATLSPSLAKWPNISAVVNYGNGYVYVFLNDGRYLRADAKTGVLSDGYPASTSSGWSGVTEEEAKQIVAAVNYGNGKVYLFLKNNHYLRYDINTDRVDSGYPMVTSEHWHGITATWANNLVAAVSYGNGKVYFFANDGTYIRYDVAQDKVDAGYPAPTNASNWDGTTSKTGKQIVAAYSLASGIYGFLFAQGVAHIGRNIAMDAYFGAQPGGGVPTLYSNGNQQLPLYVAICPVGSDTTPISDDELSQVKQYLLINDANNNQEIGFNCERNGALYTYTKNDYQHGIGGSQYYALPTTFHLMANSGACRDPNLTRVIAVYLQSSSLDVSKAVYVHLNYFDAYDKVHTISTHDSSSNTTFRLHVPQTYSEQSFTTWANWLSYYSWTVALNWMYDINRYTFTRDLGNQGFYIGSLSDETGKDARMWSGPGTNYNLIQGLGGINDGQVNAANYDEGPLTTPEHERFNNSGDWTQLYNSQNYGAGESFYPGSAHTFYIGTWHGPGGSGNWGQHPYHHFKGFDNYGNPIDVSLRVCAGADASDGDCNMN